MASLRLVPIGAQSPSSSSPLSRQDYRDAFRRAGLQILEERPRHPDLSRSRLIPELKDELRKWPDGELFSNQVLFA
jgi:hypothetical protein